MAKYFGTDGFRGEANKTLTVEHAYKIGRFLGWYYNRDKKEERCRVVIGKDTRRSSYMFEYSLAAGLTASGADAYLLHVTTTPSVSYVAQTEGLDCANGSAWMIAKSVFDALGASTYVINNNPNGLNINAGCGSTHIDGLIQFVKDKKLDVGFAFDGDADRCLCVDENGRLIDGDLILYIYGRYMKERGKLEGNKIVTTIMSNFGLYKALDEAGIEYEKTAVKQTGRTRKDIPSGAGKYPGEG